MIFAGGDAVGMEGLTTEEAVTFIALSLCLTFTVFAINLYGMRHVFLGLLRASAKVRASVTNVSKSAFSTSHKTLADPEQPTCMDSTSLVTTDKEHHTVVTWRASVKGEVTGADLGDHLNPATVPDGDPGAALEGGIFCVKTD